MPRYCSWLVGQHFGRLTVESFVKLSGSRTNWKCICSCGEVKVLAANLLLSGNTTSCGCGKVDRARAQGYANTKHGHTRNKKPSREWNSWDAMKKRCTLPTHHAYPRYAGRGITVCERWLNSFENFLADMGPRPIRKSLERIDNSKGYEPGNCEWATQKKQMANTRANIILTIDGITASLPVWAEKSGNSIILIKNRVYAGWDHKLAVFTPARARVPERADIRRKAITIARQTMEARGGWKYGPKVVN